VGRGVSSALREGEVPAGRPFADDSELLVRLKRTETRACSCGMRFGLLLK
jgi:hypothetical protein